MTNVFEFLVSIIINDKYSSLTIKEMKLYFKNILKYIYFYQTPYVLKNWVVSWNNFL